MTRLLLSFALCLFAATLPAQVLINEISAANMNGLLDGDGDREDWVELYNAGPGAVDLSGWFFSDKPGNPQKWVVPNGQIIAAGAYRTVFCSGKDKVAGPSLHTNFKLTQTKGESFVLTHANGTTVDSYTFSIPNQDNDSYGRTPNGGASWEIYTAPTPGAANSTAAFQAYAPSVQASQDAGFYTGNTMVSLSTDPGFSIRYTTNGSEPTSTSTLYSVPINITTTTVLKARAFSAGGQILPGFVTFNTYFINVNHTIPVVSVAGNNLAALLGGTKNRPFGSFEYFENQVLIDEAYGEFNKHGNDSWAYAQRGIDWITRDQMGYKDELKHKFFEDRTRTKFQRLILKAAANDNYPASNGGAHIRDSYVHTLTIKAGMKVDARTHQSCILYANGQYWGVYDLREKVDDADFTKYYFDQDEQDIDYIKTWGPTWSEYGSSTDWYTLKAFILGNNMTVPANYNAVLQEFNLLSLVDYVIINQHTVCKDWLNWNTSWWRGRNPNGDAERWRYALWDMDATFGHYINYTGIPNIGPTADPCDVEDIPNSGDPQNHIDIFMALYANPEFKALYINRYAELLNTYLSCDYMNALLDSMTNTIAPEMAQHCARWGGNVATWNQHVQEIHDFINTRCQILDQSIVDCYDVTGPYPLSVKVSPDTVANQVKVQNFTPTTYPYVGDYFGGVSISLLAKPATGWQFDHWEVMGNSFGPDQFTDAISLAFDTAGMVTAFFVPIVPCTEPMALAISDPMAASLLSWNGPTSASSFHIQYRKMGDPLWINLSTTQSTWNFDTLPGCGNYEMQIQSVCPQDTSTFIPFAFTTPDQLLGFGLADALICNSDLAVLDATFPGASYQWDNGSNAATRSVTNPGEYWVTINLDDCTLTDTVIVSQINATSAIQPALCPGGTFLIGGQTFDAQNPSGEVILANMGAGGCDSIVNVTLNLLQSSQNDIYNTSCDPAAVGVDTFFLSNAVGCDSLVITTTSYAAFSQTSLSASSCNPNAVGVDTVLLVNQLGCDSLVITTTAFDPAAIPVTSLSALNCDAAAVGVDTVFLTSMAGCDSLVVTTTSYAPFSQTLLSASSCNPNLVGVDTILLVNQLGCDSLVITTTAFDPAAIPVTSLSALNCDAAAVGVDTVFLTSMAGCDSLVVTTTSYAPFSQTLLSASSCNPNLVGVDTVLLINQLGCDSLVITTTAFDPAAIPVTTLSALNCDAAAVGVDTVILTSTAGCDSLVVTTTSAAPFSQISLSATSCNPNLVGIDTLLLSNQFGCDSLVITTTAFNPAGISTTPIFAKNCDPAGVGVDTVYLTNVTGCDSLVITTTSLAPFSETFLSATSCDPNLVGIDTLTLATQFGCDSLVITARSFIGLDFEALPQNLPCFGANDGIIQLDTALTPLLPVAFELENQPIQFYTGAPLIWQNLAPGVYSLVATNSEGCTISKVVDIAERDPLQLDFGLPSVELHLGDSVWVEPTADFQIDLAQWLPESGVFCPTCPATFIAARESDTYTLTVFDADGCSTSASLTLKVDKGIRVYVPNAIRLGSSGPNANLIIFTGPEVIRIRSLQVFDRWGNQLFEQQDQAPNVPIAWDGTFRGQLINPGVIIWLAEIETIDGRVEYLSGDITVLR